MKAPHADPALMGLFLPARIKMLQTRAANRRF